MKVKLGSPEPAFDKTLGGEIITGADYTVGEHSFGGLNLRYHFAIGTSCGL